MCFEVNNVTDGSLKDIAIACVLQTVRCDFPANYGHILHLKVCKTQTDILAVPSFTRCSMLHFDIKHVCKKMTSILVNFGMRLEMPSAACRPLTT